MRIVNFASESNCIESQYQQYHKILSTELLLWFHTVYTAIKENKSEILISLHGKLLVIIYADINPLRLMRNS